jgi:hypothetical protein
MFTSMLMQVRIHHQVQVKSSIVNGKGGRLGAKRRGGRPDADAVGYFLNGQSSLRTLAHGTNSEEKILKLMKGKFFPLHVHFSPYTLKQFQVIF